jgi:hypothetical protein
MRNTIFVFGIICFGLVLRLAIFCVSPPNNSFDDHLEPIMIYKNSMNIPLPNQCWECYQPPVYYGLCAIVLSGAEALDQSKFNSWRLVQLVNPLISVFVLFLFYRILLQLEVSLQKSLVLLSFLAVLPIDLLTCSMIGNDYLLVLFSVLTFYSFLRFHNQIIQSGHVGWLNFFLLCFFSVLGALTKQHGLLLIIFPGAALLLMFKDLSWRGRLLFSTMVLMAIISSLSNEIMKFRATGKFLVSNQDFYNYTEGQFPGAISRVEFFTFRFYNLMKAPFMSEQTSASFITEIFARIFFDYEWRFTSPHANGAIIAGQVAYVYGAFWVLYFVILLIIRCRGFTRDSLQLLRFNSFFTVSAIVLIFFALVPFVQTLRFPYFSSMKATFFLPGVVLFLALIGKYLMKTTNKTMDYSLIVINLSFGIYFVLIIYEKLPFSLSQLSGPLWSIP